jgi:tetratricopeptide (TPR) repeat protein
MHDFAEMEFQMGDARAALEIAAEGLSAARELGDVYLVAVYVINMAEYLVALDRFDEARTYAREALDSARRVQADTMVAIALQHLAAVAILRPNSAAGHETDRERRGARLLGFVDAHYAQIQEPRWPGEQVEYGRAISSLRAAIAADELAALMATGAAAKQEEAIEEALLV